MLYIYSKDICGFEFCERFESESDLQKYCFLHLPKNDAYMIAWVAYPGENETWEANEDYTPNIQAIAACVEEAEKEGLVRPFWVVCTGDCEYRAIQNEEDVDFFGLCKIWEDWGAYRIALCRYATGEITPEQADKEKKYLLAKYIREDGTNNEYKEDYDDDNE